MASTLVIGGEGDFMFPPEAMSALLQIPGAQQVSLPGVGHLPFVEDPEGSAREVRTWWSVASAGA